MCYLMLCVDVVTIYIYIYNLFCKIPWEFVKTAHENLVSFYLYEENKNL